MESSDEIFKQLFEKPENTVCFHCQAQPVTSGSAAYGIFLCSECADTLSSVPFTTVKALDSEWTDEDLKLIKTGGNQTLSQFLEQFTFPDTSLIYKFKTKAGAYYRDMLATYARGEECVVAPPEREEGITLYEPPEEEEKSGVKEKIYSKVVSAGQDIKGKVMSTGQDIKSKFEELASNQHVKDIEDKYTTMVAKGKEWAENPGVQKIKEKTAEAYSYVATKTKEAIDAVSSHPKVAEMNQDVSKMFHEASQVIIEKVKKIRGEGDEPDNLE